MSQRIMTDQAELLREALELAAARLPAGFQPDLAITLGSGLAELASGFKVLGAVSYADIPGFAAPRVPGHRGELIAAEWNGKKIIALSGRIHFYEGFSMAQCTFPARLAIRMGARVLLLTAAVGGVNKKFNPGDLVVIEDHLNMMGTNPLRGVHDESFGERFPDLSECYSKRLAKLALAAAKKLKVKAHSGIYCATPGPSYETAAEVRAYARLGADVVGMSVVPETIVARQMGAEVLAVAYVSNRAAGISKKPISHAEVLAAGKQAAKALFNVLGETVKQIPSARS